MIELLDTLPDINVQPAEYKRLLGYPRERVLSGRARELAEQARAWYAANGRPWVYARQAESVAFDNGSIKIDGTPFISKRLQSTLQQAEWDIAEQPRLLDLIRRAPAKTLPSAVDVLESGMLRPKKSLLAVFGLTRQ